jgi:dihydrofolate reductase
MGRRTSEFIPEKLRPLRGRFNVVQSSSRSAKNSSFDNNLFDAALALLAATPLSSDINFVFVIRGGQVYRSVTNLETDLFAFSQLSLYVPTTVSPSCLSCVVFFFPPIHEHHQSATSIEILIVLCEMASCREAVNSPLCDAVHLTEIKSSFNCDTFMAAVDVNLFQVRSSSFPVV